MSQGRPKGSKNKPKLLDQETILEVIKTEIRNMFAEHEIKFHVEFIKKETRGRKADIDKKEFKAKVAKLRDK